MAELMKWLLIAMLFVGLAPEAALAGAACHIQPGHGGMIIRTTVLEPDRAVKDDEVLIGIDGKIACVGKECRKLAPEATLLSCPDAVLSPGFINTHDHIDFGHIAPRPDSGERYEHRHEWRKGLDGHRLTQTFVADRDPAVIAWNELRFLVGGTTSTVGESWAPGLLRNLDFQDGLEGLTIHPVTYKVFPLDDASGIMRTSDCDYGEHPTTREQVSGTSAFLAHVAEGRDEAARNEFRCESSRSYDVTSRPDGSGISHDWIMPQAALIHAVGLTGEDMDLVAKRHAKLVWSPRSNLSLYGRTLDILGAEQKGITVALSSDWLPSGSMSLNRELACAVHYNHEHLNDALSDRDLWKMVTINAAKVAGADKQIGSIEVGKAADLVLFSDPHHQAEHAVVRAGTSDVMLVMRGGVVLLGLPEIVDIVRPGCEALDVGGEVRALCPEGRGRPDAVTLEAYARKRGLYPIAFSGKPENEPVCEVTP
ncbi:MAG: amidohydrolase family protein [Acetobacter sp.]|nr:amidohydrolase family protein [Acetobacter sp.]MCI1292910.1 amidohydrolase family protein [Acetobacter sp.]